MLIQIQIRVLLASGLHIWPIELVAVVGHNHVWFQFLDVGNKLAQHCLLIFLIEHVEGAW